MGADHPNTWCKTVQGGRSFYTGSGHTQASYTETGFRSMILGGIRYAANRTKADCRPETGYTTLYNGSTTGWSQAGPGGFANSDGTLTSSGGMGMLWYSAKEFRSYSLKLDWRMPGDDNSGVVIGFPAGSDPATALAQGHEVQIDATDTADKTTGSIYGFKAADLAARDAALNPPGEWNTYELLVEGERVQVFLNGVKINDFTNTDPARSLASGHIGIQNHGTGDDVSFRNIRIKELGGIAHRTDRRPWRQVRRRQRRRHRRRYEDPALDLHQRRQPAMDRQRRHVARLRQVHDRRGRQHRQRRSGAAVHLQRQRCPELDGRRQRLAGQPAVEQVPRRQRRQHGQRHPVDHLDLPRRHQPTLDPALTITENRRSP